MTVNGCRRVALLVGGTDSVPAVGSHFACSSPHRDAVRRGNSTGRRGAAPGVPSSRPCSPCRRIRQCAVRPAAFAGPGRRCPENSRWPGPRGCASSAGGRRCPQPRCSGARRARRYIRIGGRVRLEPVEESCGAPFLLCVPHRAQRCARLVSRHFPRRGRTQCVKSQGRDPAFRAASQRVPVACALFPYEQEDLVPGQGREPRLDTGGPRSPVDSPQGFARRCTASVFFPGLQLHRVHIAHPVAYQAIAGP